MSNWSSRVWRRSGSLGQLTCDLYIVAYHCTSRSCMIITDSNLSERTWTSSTSYIRAHGTSSLPHAGKSFLLLFPLFRFFSPRASCPLSDAPAPEPAFRPFPLPFLPPLESTRRPDSPALLANSPSTSPNTPLHSPCTQSSPHPDPPPPPWAGRNFLPARSALLYPNAVPNISSSILGHVFLCFSQSIGGSGSPCAICACSASARGGGA